MAASSSSGAVNYWPGYVDALTNVVLNLLFAMALFCAGVFTLGLYVVHLAAPASRVADRERPGPIVTTAEPVGESKPAAGPAPDETARPAEAHGTARPAPSPVEEPSAEPGAETQASAKRTAPGVEVDGSPAVRPEPEVRPAAANVPTATPAPSLVETAPTTIEIHPVAVAPRTTAPEVRVIQVRGGPALGLAQVEFATSGVRIDKRDRPAIAQALSPVAGHKPAVQVTLWALVDRNDGQPARRAAYYRVMAVRELLVDLGIPPEQISLRLQNADHWVISNPRPVVFVHWQSASNPPQ